MKEQYEIDNMIVSEFEQPQKVRIVIYTKIIRLYVGNDQVLLCEWNRGTKKVTHKLAWKIVNTGRKLRMQLSRW